jgi:ATP adenylyltransferase
MARALIQRSLSTVYNPPMSTPYNRLRGFLAEKMQMSHIYQPVMLETLLERGGQASIREIAAQILAHDESQLDYYEQIVKNMPGRVLASHGIVERAGDEYVLAPAVKDLSDEERRDLVSRCHQALDAFKDKRGVAIWEHRRPGLGIIPGRARYETLKRAAFRCELCGISADERALDVDHILPKSQGGTDDPENLQALCCTTWGNSTDSSGHGSRWMLLLRITLVTNSNDFVVCASKSTQPDD